MELTAAQKTAIKNDILASPDLNVFPNTQDGAFAIADLYALPAPNTFFVWKNLLHEQEITGLTSGEGTVWSWTAFIARSVSEQTGWARMFNGTYTINPSLLQVRNGVNDIFSGGTGAAQRAHVTAISKTNCNRLERLLADTSNGVGTLPLPATRTFIGRLSYGELFAARNSV